MSDPKGIKIIKEWWWIIAFIFALGVSYQTLNASDTAQQKEIATLKAQMVITEATNAQVLTQLSAIQTDILWIKKTLSR